jgi:hypothetical protein
LRIVVRPLSAIRNERGLIEISDLRALELSRPRQDAAFVRAARGPREQYGRKCAGLRREVGQLPTLPKERSETMRRGCGSIRQNTS